MPVPTPGYNPSPAAESPVSRDVAIIVDDVPDLLQVMAEAVELALPDHVVHTARDAGDAEALLDRLEARGEQLRLLVTDQALGGRTGLDLMADAARRYDTALLLITGRATDHVEHAARALGARVLWKPFRLTTLVTTIREVTTRPASAAPLREPQVTTPD